jgi:hypothetical protein
MRRTAGTRATRRRLLYGLPDLRHGARELVAEGAWDPPPIPAGGSAQVHVPLNGARPGDFVQAAYSLSTSASCSWRRSARRTR